MTLQTQTDIFWGHTGRFTLSRHLPYTFQTPFLYFPDSLLTLHDTPNTNRYLLRPYGPIYTFQTPSLYFQDTFLTLSRHLTYSFQTPSLYFPDSLLTLPNTLLTLPKHQQSWDTIQTPSKHPPDTLQTSFWHPPDMFQTPSRQLQDNLQTPYTHPKTPFQPIGVPLTWQWMDYRRMITPPPPAQT